MEEKEMNIEKLYEKGVKDSFIVGILTIALNYLIFNAQVFELNYSFAGNSYIEFMILGIGVLIVWLYKSIDLLENYFSAGGIYEREISIKDGGQNV